MLLSFRVDFPNFCQQAHLATVAHLDLIGYPLISDMKGVRPEWRLVKPLFDILSDAGSP